MRSFVIKQLVVFSLLGGIATIVIALWGAVLSQPKGFNPQRLAEVRREFFDRATSQRSLFPLMAYDGFAAQFIHIAIDDADVEEDVLRGPYPCASVVRAGWPWLAFDGWCFHDSSRRAATTKVEHRWSIPIANQLIRADRLLQQRMIPLRPLWPGLALNWLTMAIGLWLVWAAAILIRRTVRIRRRLCPNCAYPMGVSSRCSECGCDLPNRTATL